VEREPGAGTEERRWRALRGRPRGHRIDRRHPRRVDHQPQRQTLRPRWRRRRHTIDGREHATGLPEGTGQITVVHVSFELELPPAW